MRTTSLAALVALAASLSGTVACSVATDGAPEATREPPPAAGADGKGTPATSGSLSAPPLTVTVLATVPTGIGCLVATVTGADTETVTGTVAAGASTATLNLGTLNPGLITVTENAYNTACPASGTPTWVSEPVQAEVVAGVATQIQVTLHANAQSTVTSTFSLPAIAIAAGGMNSYAVLSDGTVRAWGSNAFGELGVSPVFGPSTTPVVVPGVTNAVSISAGGEYACVVRTDSSVMCWGMDSNGFLTPTPENGWVTNAVLSPGLSVTQLSAGLTNTVVIGTGTAPLAYIGGGAYAQGSAATCVWTPYTNPMSIAAGASDVGVLQYCWVSQEGVTSCNWGGPGMTPTSGLFGYGESVKVFAGVSAGASNYACAILPDGNVNCWGDNTFGELGVVASTTFQPLTAVPGLQGVTTMALSRTTLDGFSCAVVAGGGVMCSGANNVGQLGNDLQGGSNSAFGPGGFTPVVGLTNVVSVAAGYEHACALDAAGAVHCWGDNDYGQIGDGTVMTRFAPVTVQPW